MAEAEHPSVRRFREYLRIPAVHPFPDYTKSIEWLKHQALEIGLEFRIVHFPKPAEFALWLTWKGMHPGLSSILLNSHIDVVPVDATKWTRDPFGAEKDSNGNIFARGAQDMKSVGVQYLEAIRNLRARGILPLRDVHVSFVPDEEVGGKKGMGYWVTTPEFAALKVGFALDESVPSPDEKFVLFNAERSIWQFRVTAIGKTGHASIMFEGTAAEKLHYVINRFQGLRTEQQNLLKFNPNLTLGDVTSVNLTMLDGGLQANVVPPELSATYDMRITPEWDFNMAEKLIHEICASAGGGVRATFIQQNKIKQSTSLGTENVWWAIFSGVANKLHLPLKIGICPGATDARFLRQIGIPALGFSPMNFTPVLLHAHDEFLNENIFLRGIGIYEALLTELTQLQGMSTT